MRRDGFFPARLLLLLILAGACADEPPALRVGPVGYSAEELGVLGQAQKESLARLTAFGLAIADGRAEELMTPYVQRDLGSLQLQRLALELAADSAGVDETSLRAAYLEDPRHELVVRHLVVLSERWRPRPHRDSARARAEDALRAIRTGAPFEAVAGEYSDEPGAAERGGLLEPGREGSWVPEFWQAASALDEGEVSGVVESEFGFHVLRLEERRTVPFEEVRGDVLERVVTLPRALGRAQSWSKAVLEAAVLEPDAVEAWTAGETPMGPLVHWPDSLELPPLTATDLDDYLATQPAEQRSVDGPEEALLLALHAARTHAVLAEARRRDLQASASQQAAIHGRWRDRVARWAGAFGFRPGQSPELVKLQALDALGSTRQGVMIARSELEEVEGVLRTLYPVESRDTSAVAPPEG